MERPANAYRIKTEREIGGIRRISGAFRRVSALFILAGMMSVFPLSPLGVSAADKPAAPEERILYKNGFWETAYWGDEGRMAYRYAGSAEINGKAPSDALEQEITIDEPTFLRAVVTVHKNSGDNNAATLKSVINGDADIFEAAWPETDGEIALTDEEGTVYGPFECKMGSPAVINGEIQPYVLWVADTGELRLEPGKYTVSCSRPDMPVINDETGNRPAMLLKGVDAARWEEYAGAAGAGRSFQGSYRVEARDEDGNAVTGPLSFGMIDKGDSVEVVGMIADMPVDQSLGIISRTDDTIRAGGSFSLPARGLFDLSLDMTIRFENGEWVFSGEWNFSRNVNGDNYASTSAFNGKMTGRDMPGCFFPKPAAGLGSLGNIPGPANETQAAAGVVTPGLIALLASVIAGRGRSGGGSGGAALFTQPAGTVPSGGGTAGPPSPRNSGGINSGEAYDINSGNALHNPSGGGVHFSGSNDGNAAMAGQSGHGLQPSAGGGAHAANVAEIITGGADKEGFPKIVNEWMPQSGHTGRQSPAVNEQMLGIIAEGEAKRRLIGRLEGMLKSAEITGTGNTEAQSRISTLLNDLVHGRKNYVQASNDVPQIRDMLAGRPSGDANALAQSIQKSLGQVVDTSSGNMFNDVGMQVANDVATGGLSDFGFSGGDMLKAAVRSIDADDMLADTAIQLAPVRIAEESVRHAGINLLSPAFKPRTGLPESLIKTVQGNLPEQ